ncbi:hypothetical protein HK102_010754 [Quaeritorhiza haematococci]|nr:hypothetical protein HK102_010754 [Quaeritorhiza haematococci]
MKGKQFFDKQLGRPFPHRRAMLRNLLSQLLTHQRIQTTLPKAKVLQYYADQAVSFAKSGTPEDLEKAKSLLAQPDKHLPLLLSLAKRYTKRTDGFARVMPNGYRSPASDRAPLAIIEYVDNPNDLMHAFAKKHLAKVRQDLEEIEKQKYHHDVYELRDPVTGEPQKVVKLRRRHDLSVPELARLERKEMTLRNLVDKLEASLVTQAQARMYEGSSRWVAQVEPATEVEGGSASLSEAPPSSESAATTTTAESIQKEAGSGVKSEDQTTLSRMLSRLGLRSRS